jgi:tetratricopeptide (TPR) repeat protein
LSPASARCRVGRRGVALRSLLVLLLVSFPAAAQQSGVFTPAYDAVVLRYQAGDQLAAVAEIAGWPASRLREEMTALNALREKARRALDPKALILWHQVPVRAALMLHSDCAQRARIDKMSPDLHEWVAAEIARMLRDDSAQRAFARRWYGVMAGLASRENRWPDALVWAERGLQDFPDSAELLVALGAIEEVHALQASRGAPPPARERLADAATRRDRSALLQRREVRGHLEKARQALVAAVAADPSLTEAHLRLGRLGWRLGEEAEARSALEAVLARDHTQGEAFLAHLFLGRLHEDAGRLEEAARSYEAALGLEVNSQSARLALSHVRLRRGDAPTARAEAQRALRPAGARLRPDPFWLYPWGPSVGVEDRLEALRREARS